MQSIWDRFRNKIISHNVETRDGWNHCSKKYGTGIEGNQEKRQLKNLPSLFLHTA